MKVLQFSILFLLLCTIESIAQEKVHQIFKDTRVINTHSVETLRKGIMDIRIAHRFGDFAGDAGGWPTFYGLETASDVMIGLEYGISNNLMVGVSRTKGSGPLKQNINGFLKFRVMSQDVGGSNPFSVTFVGTGSYSSMQKCSTPGLLCFFGKTAHRYSYNFQAIIGSRLTERLSLQANLSWTYRNNVEFNDQNDLPSAGVVFKYQFSKVFALIVDATFPFSEFRNNELGPDGTKEFYRPLGVGFEWETGGGHVFQINFTNATGLIETDYIPYTTSDWGKGEYRLGFTISRQFKL